jgi:hypothetical protein
LWSFVKAEIFQEASDPWRVIFKRYEGMPFTHHKTRRDRFITLNSDFSLAHASKRFCCAVVTSMFTEIQAVEGSNE